MPTALCIATLYCKGSLPFAGEGTRDVYLTVEQSFSVYEYPPRWQYPLHLALQTWRRAQHSEDDARGLPQPMDSGHMAALHSHPFAPAVCHTFRLLGTQPCIPSPTADAH